MLDLAQIRDRVAVLAVARSLSHLAADTAGREEPRPTSGFALSVNQDLKSLPRRNWTCSILPFDRCLLDFGWDPETLTYHCSTTRAGPQSVPYLAAGQRVEKVRAPEQPRFSFKVKTTMAPLLGPLVLRVNRIWERSIDPE